MIDRVRSGENDVWTLGNATLYQLCKDYPEHTDPRAIVAKMWLFGRAYSAAVERRKNNKGENQVANDSFYEKKVTEAMMESELDEKMDQLGPFDRIDSSSIIPILEVHHYLVSVLRELTGLEKRSLASKYLHFHKPNLFYIYDSRANSALRRLKPTGKVETYAQVDYPYAKFAFGVMELQELVEQQFGEQLTPH